MKCNYNKKTVHTDEEYAKLCLDIVRICLIKDFGWGHDRMGNERLRVNRLLKAVDEKVNQYLRTFDGDLDCVYDVVRARIATNGCEKLAGRSEMSSRVHYIMNYNTAIYLEVLMEDFGFRPADCSKLISCMNREIESVSKRYRINRDSNPQGCFSSKTYIAREKESLRIQ